MRAVPDGPEVLGLIGREPGDPARDQADAAATTIADLVRLFVRGNGFSDTADGVVVADGIASVILTASARLLFGQATFESDGGYSVRGGTFQGWTLAERSALNAFRTTLGVA